MTFGIVNPSVSGLTTGNRRSASLRVVCFLVYCTGTQLAPAEVELLSLINRPRATHYYYYYYYYFVQKNDLAWQQLAPSYSLATSPAGLHAQLNATRRGAAFPPSPSAGQSGNATSLVARGEVFMQSNLECIPNPSAWQACAVSQLTTQAIFCVVKSQQILFLE